MIILEVKAVADYKQGSQKAMNYLVGKCLMKLNRRAHPNTVREALESKLEQKDGKQG